MIKIIGGIVLAIVVIVIAVNIAFELGWKPFR